MHVSLLRLRLELEGCETANQKRTMIRAMQAKLRAHFNVSTAELDRFENPSEAVLGVVSIGRSRKDSHEVLTHVSDAIAGHPHVHPIGPVQIKDL